MKYMVDAQPPADDELLTGILQVLAKQHGIRFVVTDTPEQPWQPQSHAELQERVAAADAQPRLSFAEARQRLGL